MRKVARQGDVRIDGEPCRLEVDRPFIRRSLLEGGGGAASESGEEGTDAGPKRRRLRKGRKVVEDEELE